MSIAFVGTLGRFTIDRGQTLIHMATILVQAMKAFIKLSFLNSAVSSVIFRQTYFTSYQALPVIVLSALILGSITVNYLLAILTGLGAYDQIGKFMLTAMLHEIAPITCTIIMLLRSGSAIISEVALMKINKETDTLNMLGVGIPEYIYMPRIIAFLISGPTLTLVFSLVGLLGGFFILGFFHDITFDNYMDQLFLAITPRNIFIVIIKPLILSLGVILVCLQKGMTVRSAFTEVPIKLIQGMMHIVTMVIFIEIIFSFI